MPHNYPIVKPHSTFTVGLWVCHAFRACPVFMCISRISGHNHSKNEQYSMNNQNVQKHQRDYNSETWNLDMVECEHVNHQQCYNRLNRLAWTSSNCPNFYTPERPGSIWQILKHSGAYLRNEAFCYETPTYMLSIYRIWQVSHSWYMYKPGSWGESNMIW